MLTRHSVFDISRETRALLSNNQGNNGRALRRFLSRVSADGLVLQVFTDYPTELSPAELANYKAYAAKLREQVVESCFEIERLAERETQSHTIADDMFSVVENSYQLKYDTATASVAQLRADVFFVQELSDDMHPFAADPAGELHSVSPEAAEERRHAYQLQEMQANERFNQRFMGFLRS